MFDGKKPSSPAPQSPFVMTVRILNDYDYDISQRSPRLSGSLCPDENSRRSPGDRWAFPERHARRRWSKENLTTPAPASQKEDGSGALSFTKKELLCTCETGLSPSLANSFGLSSFAGLLATNIPASRTQDGREGEPGCGWTLGGEEARTARCVGPDCPSNRGPPGHARAFVTRNVPGSLSLSSPPETHFNYVPKFWGLIGISNLSFARLSTELRRHTPISRCLFYTLLAKRRVVNSLERPHYVISSGRCICTLE